MIGIIAIIYTITVRFISWFVLWLDNISLILKKPKKLIKIYFSFVKHVENLNDSYNSRNKSKNKFRFFASRILRK